MGGDDSKSQQAGTYTPYQQQYFKNYLQSVGGHMGANGQDLFDSEYNAGNGYYAQHDAASGDYLKQAAGDFGGAADFMQGAASNAQGYSEKFNPMMESYLSNTMGAYDPNNPMLGDIMSTTRDNAYQGLSRQVGQTIDADAIMSGTFGSSRQGVQAGVAQADLESQLAQQEAGMRYQDYQTHMGRQDNVAANYGGYLDSLNSGDRAAADYLSQAGGLNQAASGAMQQEQGLRQQEMDADMQAWAYENNVDADTLTTLRGLLEGNMGGTQDENTMVKTASFQSGYPSYGGGGGGYTGGGGGYSSPYGGGGSAQHQALLQQYLNSQR